MSTISWMILTACSSSVRHEVVIPETKFVYLTPEIVPRPTMPKLRAYDARYGLNSKENFRIFQTNSYILHEHIINLNSTIKYYEDSILELQQQKNK